MRRSYIATFAVLSLAACGGGSDEDKAKRTVTQFFTALDKNDTAKLCEDLLTEEFIEQTTGATGDRAGEQCPRAFSRLQASDVELGKFGRVSVDGEEATVRAAIVRQGHSLPQVFRLKKEDGDWRLAGSGTG